MGKGSLHIRAGRRRKWSRRDRARAAGPDRFRARSIRRFCRAFSSFHTRPRFVCLLSSLLGFDPRRYRDNLDQNPAALNIVDFKDAAARRLTLFNDTSHYAETGHAIPDVPIPRLSTGWSEDG